MTPDSENWSLLQKLFHLAEETPAEDRARVLADHCPDTALVERALTIIRSSEAVTDRIPLASPSLSQSRVGPYTLVRLLGSGGIGSVYLAQRQAGGPPQQVALKMLAPHAAGASFIERFHREQHILGSLDHPNITRLLDAGVTDTGQSYLVMEYIDGEHLDAHCDEFKLEITERLRLFVTICDAVAYAHRSLVVHLDLKPSNILVSTHGKVKLLDFGTSKLLQTDGLSTTTVLATPAYASPEQLRNEPVTTACDVYSLGAILFELLTGKRPYAGSSVAAMMERALQDQTPEGPLDAVTAEGALNRGVSELQLRQMLRGDLQTIVTKCISPRPYDRYTSSDALKDDVERYLAGEPVMARPQTILYRLDKFVHRHQSGVAIAVATAMLLLASGSYAAWRQQQALREAQRAERMQTFMHQLFRLANSNYTGKPAVTVPEFLQLGVKTLPDYIRNPADLLQAKIALAESMYDNGDLNDAKTIFMETAATARSLNDIEAQAESYAYAGQIAFSQGDESAGKHLTADALRLAQRRGVSPGIRVRAMDYYAWNRENHGFLSDEDLHLLRSAADEARRYNLPLHEKADAIHLLASNLEFRGQLDQAKPLFDEALALLNQDPASVCDKAEISGELAFLSQSKLDYQGALGLYQRAYDGYSACSGADGRESLSMLSYLTSTLTELGRAPEAVQLMERSKPAWEKLPDPFGRWGVFPTALARAYIATGRYTDAEGLIGQLAEAHKKLSAPILMAYFDYLWAEALAGEHRYDEALPHAEYAVKVADSLPPSFFVSPEGHQRIAKSKRLLSDIRARTGTSPHEAAALGTAHLGRSEPTK